MLVVIWSFGHDFEGVEIPNLVRDEISNGKFQI
jgi:hypothetical protein